MSEVFGASVTLCQGRTEVCNLVCVFHMCRLSNDSSTWNPCEAISAKDNIERDWVITAYRAMTSDATRPHGEAHPLTPLLSRAA